MKITMEKKASDALVLCFIIRELSSLQNIYYFYLTIMNEEFVVCPACKQYKS